MPLRHPPGPGGRRRLVPVPGMSIFVWDPPVPEAALVTSPARFGDSDPDPAVPAWAPGADGAGPLLLGADGSPERWLLLDGYVYDVRDDLDRPPWRKGRWAVNEWRPQTIREMDANPLDQLYRAGCEHPARSAGRAGLSPFGLRGIAGCPARLRGASTATAAPGRYAGRRQPRPGTRQCPPPDSAVTPAQRRALSSDAGCRRPRPGGLEAELARPDAVDEAAHLGAREQQDGVPAGPWSPG
jgi:hypothetical protein